VNPPVGAAFYPIYTTRHDAGRCLWQLGGPNIAGTQQSFGGNLHGRVRAHSGGFLPRANGQPKYIYENFHNTLAFNPCPAFFLMSEPVTGG